ncbi:MAG: DUF3551 domain-containing protein [Xanthobacteraceae bacterium]|nr:DUF3551 domain-containing protein [Xanthobacteraceae bacterium]
MRSLILAAFAFGILAFGTLAALSPTPAAAFFENYNLPFCMKGRDYPGVGDCRFPTYAACAADAAGRGMYCDVNPFATRYEYAPRRARRHRAVY